MGAGEEECRMRWEKINWKRGWGKILCCDKSRVESSGSSMGERAGASNVAPGLSMH